MVTEGGPHGWEVREFENAPTERSTGWVTPYVATPTSDGQVHTLEGRLCGEGSSTWSVSPDEPLVAHDPPLGEVFSAGSIPAGGYSFEVEYQADSELSAALFDATIE